MVGDRVLFSVVVGGDPEPTIAWYHNGKKLGPDRVMVVLPYNCLSIESTELSDSGMYRMYARNNGGTAMSEFMLKVKPTEEELSTMVNEMTMRHLSTVVDEDILMAIRKMKLGGEK